MSNKIVDYQVLVEGLLVDGHPVQTIAYNLKAASDSFDKFRETYPHETIRLYRTERVQMIVSQGAPRPKSEPLCPKGHKGERDGQKIMRIGVGGIAVCSICGSTDQE